MKKTTVLLFILVSLFCSCTIFSPQDQLFDGLDGPTNLEDIDLILHKQDFLSTGWICAEKLGYPGLLHPIVLTIFGCAEVQWQDGQVYKCEVWYTFDWSLDHELKHCNGYDD